MRLHSAILGVPQRNDAEAYLDSCVAHVGKHAIQKQLKGKLEHL